MLPIVCLRLAPMRQTLRRINPECQLRLPSEIVPHAQGLPTEFVGSPALFDFCFEEEAKFLKARRIVRVARTEFLRKRIEVSAAVDYIVLPLVGRVEQ